MEVHEGGCLCGAVRYRVRGKLRDVVFCHCSQCRRQTGLYYAATSADQAQLTISGEDALRWYAASGFAKRGFCGTCGSALFWRANAADDISILAGSLDDPSGLTPGYHICVAGRPDFYRIDDGLPQYEHGSPDLVIAPPD